MNLLLLLRQKLKPTPPRVPRITQAGFIKFTKKSLATYLIVFIAFSGTAGIFLFNPFGTKTADAAWFNDNWAYRKAITVTNGSDFTDRFVHFDIDTTDAPDKFQADCGDIRFTDSNNNILDYYYNTGADQCDNAGTDFYVNLNTILNGTMTIYMYYGNPSAVNGYLEGDFQGADVVVDDIAYASEEKGPAPIAYWRFDEGQGTTVEDVTSNNKDGSITGGITWITEDQCLAGKCIDKPNASGSFVTVSSPNLPTGDFTYSGWVNLKNNDSETLFNASNGSATNELSINIVSTKVTVTTDGSLRLTSNTAVSTNTWTQITVVRSGSGADNIKVYINGAQDSSTQTDSGVTLNFGSCRLMIGATDASNCSGTTTTANLGGRMDEFKIYNQALSSAQILANYNARNNPEGVSAAFGVNTQNNPGALSNGLVGYWKMDESSGNPADSSGNGNTLTNNNTATYTTGKYANSGSMTRASSQYFSIAGASQTGLNNNNNTGTLSTWIYPTLDNTCIGCYQSIIQRGGITGDSGKLSYRLATRVYASSPRIRLDLSSTGSSFDNSFTATPPSDFSLNTWYHIAATWDGANVSIYLNGQLISSQAYTGSVYSESNIIFGLGFNYNDYYSGRLDESRVFNRALSPAEVSQLYNFAPGPVGYWKMDEGSGTAISDSSGNSYTSSAFTGNTAFTNGKYGKGLTFDGTDDVVRIPEGTYTDLGATTDSFTAEAWFKTTTDFSTGATIITKRNSGAGGFPFQIYIDSSERLNVGLYDGTNSVGSTITGAKNDGKWHHVALVRDVFADTVYFYVDGVLASSTNDTTTGSLANNSDISLGAGNVNASYIDNDFNGQIDEARIYNYARTSAQIIEDMNGGHPAPGSPVSSAVAHWKLDEGYGTSAGDYSGNSNTLTLSSATSAWTNSGKFNKAWNGDGALYLSRADDSDFDVSATDDYSVSLWYKSDNASNPGATEYLFNKASASIAGYAIYANTSGNLCFAIDDDTTWSPDVASCTTTDVYDATWHHIVAVRDVTQDKTYIYLDGNLADSDTDSTSATLANSLSLYVGDRDGTNNGDEFNGDLDEIKVYRSALTADQVKIDMNRSSSQVLGAVGASSNQQAQSAANEYCPPDSSASSCTGPVGEWKFDEKTGTTANDSSGNGFSGTLTNSPSWRNGKFNSGVDFSGSTQYVAVADNASLKPTAITVEFWMYLKSGSDTNARLIDKSDNTNSGYRFVKHQNTNDCGGVTSNDKISFQINTANLAMECINTASAVSQNTWTHITGTYDGSTIAIYVNGMLSNSRAAAGGNLTYTNTATLDFGSDGGIGFPFVGTLDNVRIFNYARTPAQIAWSYNKGLPIGHWRMDECQGTSISDASGNSNTGTLTIGGSGSNTAAGTCQTSGAWFDGVAGKRNYSIELDGTDDYLQIAHNSIFDFGSKDFTISLWTKFNAIRTQILIEKFTEPGGPGWTWYMLSSTQLEFFGCNNNICQTATNTSAFTTGQWYHLMITKSGSTYTTYVDGKAIGTAINANDLTSSSNGITIGERDPSSAGQSFPLSGQVDDVRIYNYGLTATQANTLYNEGAARFGPTTGAP